MQFHDLSLLIHLALQGSHHNSVYQQEEEGQKSLREEQREGLQAHARAVGASSLHYQPPELALSDFSHHESFSSSLQPGMQQH